MSLEAAILDHAAAIRELVAAILNSKTATGPASTVTMELTADKPKAEKPKADAKKPAAEAASSQPGAEQETTAPVADAQEAADQRQLGYDDIKGPFLALIAAKGRDAGVAVLKEFGAAKLPDVKPEQFAAVLEAINKAAE